MPDHFTIDVEEYFHPTALAHYFPFDCWDALPRRSPAVISRLLGFLEGRSAKATFFILGWLAEREPGMVRDIARAGHEVASHGYAHRLVGQIGPDGFRDSLRRSKAVLEDLAGASVLGYRAPSFSIVPGLEWAFDVLLEEGYEYDASLFPITQHPTYGYPAAEPDPHWIERPGGRLAEFPATTARLVGLRLPASGGAYFRLLPLALVEAGIRQAHARHAPAMFYIHPWELDDWLPAVAAPRLQRLRTFGRLGSPWRRLERLFAGAQFRRVDETLRTL